MGAIEELEPEQVKANFETNVFGGDRGTAYLLQQFWGIGMLSHNCPVRWLLSADKSIIEYGF